MPPSSSKATPSYVKFSERLTSSLRDIERTIGDSAQTVDAVQEVAITLTDSLENLHATLVRYAGIANSVLDAVLPIARTMPLIPKNVVELLTKLEATTQKIIDNSQKTSTLISDVNSGLKAGDLAKLKAHTGELQSLTTMLTQLFK